MATTYRELAEQSVRRMANDPDTFIGRMNRMTINGTSADRTVTVTYTIADGYRFELDKNRIAKHTEESLAGAIKAAVRGVNTGYAKGVLTGGGEPLPVEPADPGQRRRLRRIAAARAEVVVRQTSPRGYVKVKLHGPSGIDVRIRPGTLGRLDIGSTELAAETTAAWNAALDAYGRRDRSARESVDDPAHRS